MTRCHHGQLAAICRECPTDRSWSETHVWDAAKVSEARRIARKYPLDWTWYTTSADPLRPVETDDPGPIRLQPRNRDTGSSVGCVLLLLAFAAGVVAGYLLGVTR